MASEVKVGGKNDLYALREARRLRGDATRKVETVINRLNSARESGGRGDLAAMVAMLGTVMVDLANVSRHHDEMWNIRQQTGQVDTTALEERIAALEARLAELAPAWYLPETEPRQ